MAEQEMHSKQVCNMPEIKQYQHISPSKAKDLKEIGATEDQWKHADETCKKKIDEVLLKYKLCAQKFGVVVIGETGSGKSATANTILGEQRFKEDTSAESVTKEPTAKAININGLDLIVVDTPGNWNPKVPPKFTVPISGYVMVINMASPRFSDEKLKTLRSIRGENNECIVSSGRFVVVLSHAESVLHNKSLENYLDEIGGDPLHTFLTVDAKDKVIAVNNSAETQYQKSEHQKAIITMMLLQFHEKSVEWIPYFMSFLPSLSWIFGES